jgi:exopolysaccharide biosynthesis polyprenyl glycosylphosphotransferase
MITHRVKGVNHIHFILQLTASTVAYWSYIVVFARSYVAEGQPIYAERYVVYFLFLVAGMVIHHLWSRQWTSTIEYRRWGRCHTLAFQQTLFAGGCLAFYLVANKDHVISRAFLFSFLPIMYGLLMTSHRLLPMMLAKNIFKGDMHRTVLIGSGIRASSIHDWLARKAHIGLNTIGLLLDERDACLVDGRVPVLGFTIDFEDVVRKHQITHAILLDYPYHPKVTTQLVQTCDKLGVRPLVLDNLQETFSHKTSYFEDEGLSFISMRAEPLENPWNRFLKRTLDIVVSLPVVFFLLPTVCIAVWIIHRCQSPGPLFYSQPRAGMQNRTFTILKFRTMNTDHGQVAKQASQDDDRIFSAGKLLRKYSIDELPQFWNVLEGDMSVIGPRPHLLEHNEKFAEIMQSYHIRSYIKPGISGMAQIKGFRGETKNDDDLINRVKWDVHYLENWSIQLDLNIIIQTLSHVILPPKTAY